MFIIVVGYINGDVEYYGPFPNEDRAAVYGAAITRDLNPARWFIKPMTVPYTTVVKDVLWA